MTRLLDTFLLVIAISLASGDAGYSGAADRKEKQTMTTRSIDATLKAHIDGLMAISGVVGVGQGLLENTLCIKVFVVEKTPELQRQIPKVLDGHPVVIEQTGPIKALPKGSVR